jgi:quercetin dioxygenase-like cupin family protein
MPSNIVTELAVKSHNTPDEKRRPEKTEVDVIKFGDQTVGRFTFQPGWRWSECIKPLVQTESCQLNHIGYCVSGDLTVQTTDGRQVNIGSGDSYAIPPGHDSWVNGDQPFVGIEFVSAAEFAKAPGSTA